MSDTYVALLRGINVGGKNRLPMKDLVALFTSAGASDVRTYIQSGNVFFDASETVARRMPARVSRAIANRFDLRVPVVMRHGKVLGAIVRDNPFLAAGADPARLHVAFLADVPTAARVAALDPDRSPPDEFTVRGSEIYLHCPNGVARSKLTNTYLDATLKATCTVRNWRTVLALAEMVGV